MENLLDKLGENFMAARMSSLVFKPVLGEGSEQRMEIAQTFFKQREPLYGSQAKIQKAIRNGDSKCRLIYSDNIEKPVGIFSYRRQLFNMYDLLRMRDSIEIEALSPICEEKNSLILEKNVFSVLREIKDLARELQPQSFFIRFHKTDQVMVRIFTNSGFQMFNDPNKSLVMLAKEENSNSRKRKHFDKLGSDSKRSRENDRREKELEPSHLVEATLKKVYVNQIQSGLKTIEGRVNSGIFKNFQEGTQIRFFYPQAPQDDVICKIIKINRYKSFEEMLQKEDWKKCLPQVSSIEAAVKVYNHIPGYAQRAAQNGVLALHILKLLKK